MKCKFYDYEGKEVQIRPTGSYIRLNWLINYLQALKTLYTSPSSLPISMFSSNG